MLEICRDKISNKRGDVQALARIGQAEVHHFHLEARFYLVALPFRLFQHLPMAGDQCACLGSIHRNLNGKGRPILDPFKPWREAIAADNVGQELGPEPEFTMPAGRRVARWHTFVEKDLFNRIKKA